ncbi:MAG: hypothetical protein IKL24_06630 [Clostridia bacterium]|nr:hypothetical protein [Clostridia bacterium]
MKAAKIFSLLLCLALSFSLISCAEKGIPLTDETTNASTSDTADPHAGHNHGPEGNDHSSKPAKTVFTVKFVDAMGNYVHGRSIAMIEGNKDKWIAIANARGEASFTDAQFKSISEGFTLVVTSLPDGYTCDFIGENKIALNPGATEINIVLTKTDSTTSAK